MCYSSNLNKVGSLDSRGFKSQPYNWVAMGTFLTSRSLTFVCKMGSQRTYPRGLPWSSREVLLAEKTAREILSTW